MTFGQSSSEHPETHDAQSKAQRWASSGGMWLTGRCDGPAIGCLSGVVEVLELVAKQLAEGSRRVGSEVRVDGLALLGERAALAGLSRRGSTSCGGATRLLQTADGYLALSLARPDDVALLPALFGDAFTPNPLILDSFFVDSLVVDSSTDALLNGAAAIESLSSSVESSSSANNKIWSSIETIVRGVRAQDLVDRGTELGLALAALPQTAKPLGWVKSDDSVSTTDPNLLARTHDGHGLHRYSGAVSFRLTGAVLRTKLLLPNASHGIPATRPIRVVDLSSLWAGPLCAQLLETAGCEVIKVESTSRPDGARLGSREFFDLLNGRKRSVVLDFADREDLRALIDLLASADVVIEASRPRALEQLGIDRQTLLATTGISVWLQITGHGATGADENRIGFGDDAAVAGGLVSWDDDQPVFCADAIADPATGLIAASAALEALDAGGKWVLDASLRRTAEAMAYGSMLNWKGEVAAPRARGIIQTAPVKGADTESIISALTSRPADGFRPC